LQVLLGEYALETRDSAPVIKEVFGFSGNFGNSLSNRKIRARRSVLGYGSGLSVPLQTSNVTRPTFSAAKALG
jgi:hypothetical protein